VAVRGGSVDFADWQVTEYCQSPTSVTGLMIAEAGANHARLYCTPLSHIAWLINKARSFIQLL